MPTYNENRYFLTLVDDYSKMIWTFLMKLKSDIVIVLKLFFRMVHTQFGKTVKILRTDNGVEFFSHEYRNYLIDNGIMHQSSCPLTSAKWRSGEEAQTCFGGGKSVKISRIHSLAFLGRLCIGCSLSDQSTAFFNSNRKVSI